MRRITGILLFSSLVLYGQSQSWNGLGPGLNGPVYEMVVHDNDLYVGGFFTDAGGIEDADYIARWDGCEWHAVVPGVIGLVTAIAIDGDNIYIGGAITDPFPYIAHWTGTGWQSLGTELDYFVSSIVLIGDEVYAGGGFYGAGGVHDASVVARWDGKTWHSLGSGPSYHLYDITYVSDMIANGTDLYIVGAFADMGGNAEADRIAKWDGSTWHNFGSGIDPGWLWYDWLQIAMDESNVYVSGAFINAGDEPDADYIVRWDGATWHGLAASHDDSLASAIAVFNGDLYWGLLSGGIRRYDIDKETWEDFANSTNIQCLATKGNHLYAGGTFEELNNQQYAFVARWGSEGKCASSTEYDITHDTRLAIHAFPNPTLDIMHYSFGENSVQSHRLTLTDATGQLIIATESEKNELSIGHLADGLYFLNIQAVGFSGVAKIVKN